MPEPNEIGTNSQDKGSGEEGVRSRGSLMNRNRKEQEGVEAGACGGGVKGAR